MRGVTLALFVALIIVFLSPSLALSREHFPSPPCPSTSRCPMPYLLLAVGGALAAVSIQAFFLKGAFSASLSPSYFFAGVGYAWALLAAEFIIPEGMSGGLGRIALTALVNFGAQAFLLWWASRWVFNQAAGRNMVIRALLVPSVVTALIPALFQAVFSR